MEPHAGLEPAKSAYKADALPVKLMRHGWHGRTRTYNRSVNSRMLCLLSYTPVYGATPENRTLRGLASGFTARALSIGV